MNLQPKTVETNESASASTSVAEETQNREYKVRKTDGDDENMELAAQSTNACKDESKQTLSEVATSNKLKQEEKMEVGSPEPPADEDNDIGEIHIVSVALELS